MDWCNVMIYDVIMKPLLRQNDIVTSFSSDGVMALFFRHGSVLIRLDKHTQNANYLPEIWIRDLSLHFLDIHQISEIKQTWCLTGDCRKMHINYT